MKGAFLEFQAMFGDVTDSYETEIKVLLQRATAKDEEGNFIGLSEQDRQKLADLTADLDSLNVEVTIEESNLESFMEKARKGLIKNIHKRRTPNVRRQDTHLQRLRQRICIHRWRTGILR